MISIRIIQENIIQSLGVYIIKSFKVDGVHSSLYGRMYTLNTYFFLCVILHIYTSYDYSFGGHTLYFEEKAEKSEEHILLYCIS